MVDDIQIIFHNLNMESTEALNLTLKPCIFNQLFPILSNWFQMHLNVLQTTTFKFTQSTVKLDIQSYSHHSRRIQSPYFERIAGVVDKTVWACKLCILRYFENEYSFLVQTLIGFVTYSCVKMAIKWVIEFHTVSLPLRNVEHNVLFTNRWFLRSGLPQIPYIFVQRVTLVDLL